MNYPHRVPLSGLRALQAAATTASTSSPARLVPAADSRGVVRGVQPDMHAPSGVAGQRVFDSADRLPPRARLTLLRLRDDAADARSSYRNADQQRREILVEKMKAEKVLARIEQGIQQDQRFGTKRVEFQDVPAWREAKGRLDWLLGEWTRLDDRATPLQAKAQALGGLVSNNIEQWIKNLPPHAVLSDLDPPTPKKSDTLESVRSRVEKLKADIQNIKRAPIKSSAAKALVREQVEALALAGAPNVLLRPEHHGSRIQFARKKAEKPDFTPDFNHFTDNAVGLVAWLMKPQLIAALEDEIDRLSNDAASLTDEARAAALASGADELLQLERIEAQLVEISGAIPRADCDPRAVLMIEVS
jgi:hypothetical protein